MDDLAFSAHLTACTDISRSNRRVLAAHRERLRPSEEQLALSRKLLALPV